MENHFPMVRFDGAFPFDQPDASYDDRQTSPFWRVLRKGLLMYFDQKAFGKRLRDLREEKDMSQETLAEKLNISKHHYSSIERGVRGCSIDLLLDFAELFHVSTDYLLLGRSADRNKDVEELMAIRESLNNLIRDM